uniref:ABC transporter, substrate-binding protein (Cluster 2, ribose/xylose/arabinose/galactose) n=1 Tax=uncultured Armatimonadetes bacterium TaxID=157466 RepID=A0A6J4JMX8_9BACT|nr:ABC transporter, substrate-binding protein (cluster 2, ribose/xylose/arabinose/galactose) [uncultured Armatimonadetes bacterium]
MTHWRRKQQMLVAAAGLAALAAVPACTRQADQGGGDTPAPAAGGQPPASGKTYLIGMSQANKGEPWRQAMNDQIDAAADKHQNLKVVFADAAQNNAKQVADVENFLQQGIDLLIISPNEAAPLTDVVSKAHDKGVPVILLDRKIVGEKYTTFIGADNVEIGRRAGTFVADWCQKEGHNPCNVLEVRGLEGTSGTKERGGGFREGIKKNAAVKIVASQNADWLREKAIPVSRAMLSANPDAHVVYGHNDPMAEAAVISAEGAGGDWGKRLYVGVDALPTPDGGIRSVMKDRLDVTYVYPTGGAEAIDLALRILDKKETPPKKVILETEEVTKANADAVLAKYGGK